MGYLKIKNKKDFVSNFLVPVSNLNDACILSVDGTNINCTLASADATIVCRTSIKVETDLDAKDAQRTNNKFTKSTAQRGKFVTRGGRGY